MNKYNLAQILAAWKASYDEDMEKEYPGFIQKLTSNRKDTDEKKNR